VNFVADERERKREERGKTVRGRGGPEGERREREDFAVH